MHRMFGRPDIRPVKGVAAGSVKKGVVFILRKNRSVQHTFEI
jgi:hypothetical protein